MLDGIYKPSVITGGDTFKTPGTCPFIRLHLETTQVSRVYQQFKPPRVHQDQLGEGGKVNLSVVFMQNP